MEVSCREEVIIVIQKEGMWAWSETQGWERARECAISYSRPKIWSLLLLSLEEDKGESDIMEQDLGFVLLFMLVHQWLYSHQYLMDVLFCLILTKKPHEKGTLLTQNFIAKISLFQ